MRGIGVAGLVAVLLTGCGESEGRRIAAAGLRDPSSAQFRDVATTRLASGGVAVCGEINGKNAYGAYEGFQRFVVWQGELHLDPAKAALSEAEQAHVDRAFGVLWAMCRS